VLLFKARWYIICTTFSANMSSVLHSQGIDVALRLSNKQRLFPYTPLTSWWFSYDKVFIGRDERNFICENTFIPSYEVEAGFDRGSLSVGHVQHIV